jgi:hypothetical protein
MGVTMNYTFILLRKEHLSSDGRGFVFVARSSAKLIIFLAEFRRGTGWSACFVVTLQPEFITLGDDFSFFGGE